MSDYLGHLVARTLSATEGVRPHLRSLFEPQPANGRPAFRPLAEMEVPVIELEPSVASHKDRFSRLDVLWNAPSGSPIEQPRVLVANMSAASADQEDVGQQAPERRSNGFTLPISIEVGSAEAGARGPAQPEERALQKHSPSAPVKPEHGQHDRLVRLETSKVVGVTKDEAPVQPINRPPLTETRTVLKRTPLLIREARLFGRDDLSPSDRREAPTPSRAAPVSAPRVAAQPESVARTPATSSGAPEVPAIVTVTPNGEKREAPAHGGAPTPQANRARASTTVVPASIVLSSLPPAAQPPAPADKAPSIHVTIGRVEVRATAPQPVRSQAKPSAAPVMSLDEYLRQRAAGGR